MFRSGRGGHRHQRGALTAALLLAAVVLLAACDSKPVAVAVVPPLAKAPASLMTSPPEAPVLPAGQMPASELARRYTGLQRMYLNESWKLAKLQKYVRQLHASRAKLAAK